MSVGVLLITHQPLGASLAKIAARILGHHPPGLEAMDVIDDMPCEALLEQALHRLETLDQGEGVLVLTDLYGSTPANVAVALLGEYGRLRVIAGVNLPMLLRALNYASSDLDTVAEKALQGGRGGVLLCSQLDELV